MRIVSLVSDAVFEAYCFIVCTTKPKAHQFHVLSFLYRPRQKLLLAAEIFNIFWNKRAENFPIWSFQKRYDSEVSVCHPLYYWEVRRYAFVIPLDIDNFLCTEMIWFKFLLFSSIILGSSLPTVFRNKWKLVFVSFFLMILTFVWYTFALRRGE